MRCRPLVWSWIPWVLTAALTLSSIDAAGEDAAAVSANAATPAPRLSWTPPEPDVTQYDWIQLDTKEWLKGKLERIQDDTVSFDSDKLDDLEFDWEDIAALVCAKEHTFRFIGRRTVRGAGEMRGNVIRIRVGEEIQEFQRSELVSRIAGGGRERDYWSGNLSIGLSGQTGNTNQVNVNTSFSVARETTFRRASLSYTGNLATQQSDISANNHRATAGTNFYITRRFFINAPSIEIFQDEFQNIAWRVTPSAGVGYDVIWQKKVKWEVGVSAGFQAVKFDSVDSGSDRSNDFPLVFLTRFNVDLPKRFEWTNQYQLQLIATTIGNTNQHLSSTLSFDFWGPLDLDTTFQWDWVADPQANADGEVPKSSDFRISVGFGLDF